MWGWSSLEKLAQDVRYALRAMRRSLGLTTVAVLSLALGIGANTAIFSLLDAVLLRMLPIEKPGEIVRVGTRGGGHVFSYPMFRELKQRNTVFSGVFARKPLPVSLVATGSTERGLAELVSGNYFSVLGVPPFLGRTFTEADDRVPLGHPVTVLSYNYWRRRLAADPDIVGKTIRIDSYPFTVIGVVRPGFSGVEVGLAPDVWIPMMMQPQVFGRGNAAFDQNNWGWLNILARRAPGVTDAQAQAGLNVTFQQIIEAGFGFGKRGSAMTIHLEQGGKGMSRLRADYESPLYLLMAVVALVLLIACANIANLLLARSAARRREIAVRLALGAGRMRLIRQLLTESTLLGIFGGLLGLAFSAWGVRFLLAHLPADSVPLTVNIQADTRLLGFALLVSVATGFLFGLAPALQATRPDLSRSLKNEGATLRAGSRRFDLRTALVIAQVALSLLLLVGAGLFLRSLRNAAAIDVGLNTENVLMASVNPELNGYSRSQVAAFYGQLMARLRDQPGVRAVGMSQAALLSGDYSQIGMTVPGRPDPPGGRSILMNESGGDFLQAAGGGLVRGRDFGPQDTPSSPKVALITETAARYFFGEEQAVGRKVLLGKQEVEIVGIVRDSKYRSVREQTPRIAYFSFDQDQRPVGERTIYVRTGGDPLAFAAVLRREVQALDKDLPLFNLKTFADQKAESLARERLTATLSGFFGALALLLASIGLYGVMAYGVLRRTREIGIRMSLGAQRAAVMWMVLRGSLAMVAGGIAVGLPLSLWLSRVVTTLLFGVSPGDPATLVAAALVLTVVAVLAGLVPALRASRVDPMLALRYE
jgi:predicted permease